MRSGPVKNNQTYCLVLDESALKVLLNDLNKVRQRMQLIIPQEKYQQRTQILGCIPTFWHMTEGRHIKPPRRSLNQPIRLMTLFEPISLENRDVFRYAIR